jgi:hypothetical protein
MGKSNAETDPCPNPPGGCGGQGWVTETNDKGQTRRIDCYTCGGSGRVPKMT